jgi:DNA-binding transcriptional regulator PaaX
MALADAELTLIERLEDLLEHDQATRSFVARWRTLVENADPIEYPRNMGLSSRLTLMRCG